MQVFGLLHIWIAYVEKALMHLSSNIHCGIENISNVVMYVLYYVYCLLLSCFVTLDCPIFADWYTWLPALYFLILLFLFSSFLYILIIFCFDGFLFPHLMISQPLLVINIFRAFCVILDEISFLLNRLCT